MTASAATCRSTLELRAESPSAWDRARARELVATVAVPAGAILDLGGGDLGDDLAVESGAVVTGRKLAPAAGNCDPYSGTAALGLGRDDRFDLVTLGGVLQNVYSERGRTCGRTGELDRRAGLEAVRAVVTAVSRCVVPGGGILITDDVLCEEAVPVVVRARSRAALEAVRVVADEYTAREIEVRLDSPTTFVVNSRDLCVILSHYEAVKNGRLEEWRSRRHAARQYMTASEYRRALAQRGFVTTAVQGTPGAQQAAEERDFEILAGLPTFPARRIALLATR